MFELAFFIIPSFFTYLGYIHGQRRKQIDIFSQWVFLPILFIYSFISFVIYFVVYNVLFNSQCEYLNVYSISIKQLKICINELSLSELCLVCVIAYFIGFILKHIQSFRFTRLLNLFYPIEPINETRKTIEKALNKSPLIIFIDNSNIHIGIPTSYDIYSSGIQCCGINLIFSGHKKDGQIYYHTNYLKLSKKVNRIFYFKNIISIGEFNYKTFLYFLDKKPDKDKTNTEKEIIEQIKPCVYFDQNITDNLCNNLNFSNQFLNQNFKSPPTLIITPFSLIELSGKTIMDCLKDSNKYNINFSDELSNQMCKALDYYENNIRKDIISFLEEALKQNKGRYTNTEHGRYILTEYKKYLNSEKTMEEISRAIAFDRVSALPLEQYTHKDTYLHIMRNALSLYSVNLHTSALRLVIKSYKKLPRTNNEQEKNEFRKPLTELIETSDLHENSDLVDIEIIQFAILGYGKHPVHFYTKDNPKKIKKRLHSLYTILKVVKMELQDRLKDGTYSSSTKNISLEKAKSLASLDFIFGKFSIIDNSGNIKEEFDAKTVVNTSLNLP